VRAHREFFGQLAVAENLDSIRGAIGEADRPQRRFIHARAVVKLIEIANIHRDEPVRKTRIVESAFGNAPNERHLTAFKADADRTARTRRLALAAASAGFAVAAGFALAEPLAPMFRAGTGFLIM
jgi:hypothetical protein